jgi:hypothetical protein
MKRRARQFLVFLHVVTSVGWMGQALAMCALVSVGTAARDPATRHGAYAMAHVIDTHVLVHLANASAFTGLMLAALTPWGYFRHWWVLVKFAITISQLYLGIFVLSPRLAMAADGAAGETGGAGGLVVGSALMASAIAFQAWVSVTKPWPRTPWTGSSPARPAAAWLYAAAVAVPVADFLLGRFVLGFPMPGLQLLAAVGYPVVRARRP